MLNNQIEPHNKQINLMSRRIYLTDSVDVSCSQLENDKNCIIDMFLAPYKLQEKLTPRDKVGMGVNVSENMREFAKHRQKTLINSQDDLLNSLMNEDKASQPVKVQKDQLFFEYSEDEALVETEEPKRSPIASQKENGLRQVELCNQEKEELRITINDHIVKNARQYLNGEKEIT